MSPNKTQVADKSSSAREQAQVPQAHPAGKVNLLTLPPNTAKARTVPNFEALQHGTTEKKNFEKNKSKKQQRRGLTPLISEMLGLNAEEQKAS